MGKEIPLSDELIKKLGDRVHPDWMKQSDEEEKFQRYVLKSHAVVENMMDALLTAYYFGEVNSDDAVSFQEKILASIDFAKKITILNGLGLISAPGKIHKLNNYRVAQAHIKKDDPLRKPDIDGFSRVSTEAMEQLTVKLMRYDAGFAEQVVADMNAHFKSEGTDRTVTMEDILLKRN